MSSYHQYNTPIYHMKIGLFVFAVAAGLALASVPDTCRQATWVANGEVDAIALAGNVVYIGGQFTKVGPYTGYGVPISTTSGLCAPTFPKINGGNIVHAVCDDGHGGWFVGGDFTEVNGKKQSGLAHVLSDGTLDDNWKPDPNDEVFSLARSGATVYVGGFFTSIGGKPRNHVAALDAATGNPTDWDPNAAPALSYITSFAVSGTTVYVGGTFISIGGQTRRHIAALDAVTGLATAWNPGAFNKYASGAVECLAVNGSTVYAGGCFDTIGGQPRNCIAAVDSATGNAIAWDPNASGAYVSSLLASGTTLYIGGWFNTIGGQPRNNIAALDMATGLATAWNPDADGNVSALSLNGATLYAGGGFYTVGGKSHGHIVALDTATGLASGWDPRLMGGVSSLSAIGGTVFAGGSFTSVGCQTRHYIAALDATTGAATAWDPSPNNYVNCIAANGPVVYAGGRFTYIGDKPQSFIAAMDSATGYATAWDPQANGEIKCLAVSGTTVYAGGQFNRIGGQIRAGIGAVDALNATATEFNPNSDWGVQCIAVSGNTVYAGGFFNSIGGQVRHSIAALDAATGNATEWNPDPWEPDRRQAINCIAVSGTTVYGGGVFDSIGGKARSALAALDATTGNATAWNPNPNNGTFFKPSITSIAASGATVYVGGCFDTIGNQPRSHLAALDAESGNATEWNPNAQYQALALAATESTVYAGGVFNYGKGIGHPYFAQFGDLQSSPIVQPLIPSQLTINQSLRIKNLSTSCLRISYTLPSLSHVSLRLYTINGKLQNDIVNSQQTAGHYSINWRCKTVAAGAYLVVFRAGEYCEKMLVSIMK
jgi:trimeric autotransporter adhesin